METIHDFRIEIPWFELLVIAISTGFIFIVFNQIVLNDSAEQPVNFSVSTPEQCKPDWKGDVLEQPSIKVLALSRQLWICG